MNDMRMSFGSASKLICIKSSESLQCAATLEEKQEMMASNLKALYHQGQDHWRLKLRPADRALFPVFWRPSWWSSDYEVGFDRGEAESPFIDFEFHNIPPMVRAKYLAAFHKIQFNPFIYQEVEHHMSTWQQSANCVGVHLRTYGGHKGLARENTGLSDEFLTCFAKASLIAAQHDPSMFFFIAGDRDDVNDAFGKHFIEQKLHRRWTSYTPTQKIKHAQAAAVDMLLLSKCSKLVVSSTSTFSEVAWWLGGAHASVVTCLVDSINNDTVNMEVYPNATFSGNLYLSKTARIEVDLPTFSTDIPGTNQVMAATRIGHLFSQIQVDFSKGALINTTAE